MVYDTIMENHPWLVGMTFVPWLAWFDQCSFFPDLPVFQISRAGKSIKCSMGLIAPTNTEKEHDPCIANLSYHRIAINCKREIGPLCNDWLVANAPP